MDPVRTLGVGLRQGPRGVRVLVSEVSLYGPHIPRKWRKEGVSPRRGSEREKARKRERER